jgi:hypothetical protein
MVQIVVVGPEAKVGGEPLRPSRDKIEAPVLIAGLLGRPLQSPASSCSKPLKERRQVMSRAQEQLTWEMSLLDEGEQQPRGVPVWPGKTSQ